MDPLDPRLLPFCFEMEQSFGGGGPKSSFADRQQCFATKAVATWALPLACRFVT